MTRIFVSQSAHTTLGAGHFWISNKIDLFLSNMFLGANLYIEKTLERFWPKVFPNESLSPPNVSSPGG